MSLTRRGWMVGSLGLTAAIAEAQKHAHEAARTGATFQVLDAAMAKEVEAISAQIIPSGDGPGAREAGVVYFIDRALATFEAEQRGAYRTGLDEIRQTGGKLYPGSASFAGLTSEQQIAVLRAVEKSEFFELVRKHTVWGFLGSPERGGNRGKVGWTHIGFEDKISYQPPFGYYDAEARGTDKA